MREKKEINIQIGEQIRRAREQSGLTQEQFAERIDVSPQFVSDLERGVVGLSIPTLKRVCLTLNVSSDRILFGTAGTERSNMLAGRCSELSEEDFSALLELVTCFSTAIDRAHRKDDSRSTAEPVEV